MRVKFFLNSNCTDYRQYVDHLEHNSTYTTTGKEVLTEMKSEYCSMSTLRFDTLLRRIARIRGNI